MSPWIGVLRLPEKCNQVNDRSTGFCKCQTKVPMESLQVSLGHAGFRIGQSNTYLTSILPSLPFRKPRLTQTGCRSAIARRSLAFQ
jgi:hypothetical protein